MKKCICLFIVGLSFFPIISQNRVGISEIEIKKKKIGRSKTNYLLDGKKYSGIIFENWENGSLKEDFEVENGLYTIGTRRSFDSIGNVEFDLTKVGEYIVLYWPNGQIRRKIIVVSTLKEGHCIIIFENYSNNGLLRSLSSTKDGEYHGRQLYYDKLGKLREEENYKNGDRHGYQIKYHEFGGTEKILWTNGKERG